MKTTIDIADPLLKDARKVAAREGTTLRALVEQGLRRVIAERTDKARYKWEPVIVDGNGLRPELANATWDEIRDLSYERGEP